ncbi:hypothetical protein [Taibaiella sp. KBW10]|uniref:hypothetical protein n=1 Tax=Taibaiella sp. KBW10 TaxID=2153357 RepID=UPI000F59D1C6|nr:hypothetical protein [Taibaiella sp. KBW10]
MKKIILFSVSCLLLFTACSEKRKHTCSDSIVRITPSIGFIGYSQSELATVAITGYRAGSGWGDVRFRDTLHPVNMYQKGDTLSASPTAGFYDIREGTDYKVYIPATGRTYLLTEVKKGAETYTYEINQPCRSGRTKVEPYTGFMIDGLPDFPRNLAVDQGYAYPHAMMAFLRR